MSSASEAETGALYYGCKRAIPYSVTLQEMGHPQTEPTPVTTDNNTAHGLTLGTMNSKASNSNGMRFQWLKCRKAQRFFAFLWARGAKNRADYPSKHHQGTHHLHVRPRYVIDKVQPQQWIEPTPNVFVYTIRWHSTTRMCDLFYFVSLDFSSKRLIKCLLRAIHLQGCADLRPFGVLF